MKNEFSYMPILIWKTAEKGAIRVLDEDERSKVLPLFQLVPKFTRDKDNPRISIPIPRETSLDEALAYIHKYLSNSKILLDTSLLYNSDRNEALSKISALANLFGSNITPVLTISDIESVNFDDSVRKFISDQGICLRVYVEEINDNFFSRIDSILNKLNLERKQVVFLIDCKVTNFDILDPLVLKIRQDKKIHEWKSYYIASGAFRENLMGLRPGVHDQKRTDWDFWKEIRRKLVDLRDVGFSDYTIQHPIYAPINTPNTSFSARYAKEDVWKIMKGQARNAKGNAGDLQYYAHSKLLVDLGLFCGEDCCDGDRYILNLSKNSSQSRGNATTWLRIGVNHHIALTLQQITSLH